jgi:anthranilate synthase component 1
MPLFRSLDIFPDPLALHDLNPARYPYVLESVVQGTPNARYSLVFAFPGETLTLSAEEEKDFLEELDACWNRERLPVEIDSPLPFRGGWFVYLGYELAGQIEPSLRLPPAPGDLPVAFATRIPAALILDHQFQQAWLMAEAGCEGLLDLMAADLAALVPIPPEKKGPGCEGDMLEDDPVDFLAAVERIKHYIREGDVFQVNLSRAWQGRRTLDISTLDLYRRRRR